MLRQPTVGTYPFQGPSQHAGTASTSARRRDVARAAEFRHTPSTASPTRSRSHAAPPSDSSSLFASAFLRSFQSNPDRAGSNTHKTQRAHSSRGVPAAAPRHKRDAAPATGHKQHPQQRSPVLVRRPPSVSSAAIPPPAITNLSLNASSILGADPHEPALADDTLSRTAPPSWEALTLTATPKSLLSLLQRLWDAVSMPEAVRLAMQARHVEPFLQLVFSATPLLADTPTHSSDPDGGDDTDLPPAVLLLLEDPMHRLAFHRHQIALHILAVLHELHLLEALVLAHARRNAALATLKETIVQYRYWAAQHIRLTHADRAAPGAHLTDGTLTHQRSAFGSVDALMRALHADLDTYRSATCECVEAAAAVGRLILGGWGSSDCRPCAAGEESQVPGIQPGAYNILGSHMLERCAAVTATDRLGRQQLRNMTARQQVEWLREHAQQRQRAASPSRPSSTGRTSTPPPHQRPATSGSPTRSSAAKRRPTATSLASPGRGVKRAVSVTEMSYCPRPLDLRDYSDRPPAAVPSTLRGAIAAIDHERAVSSDLGRAFARAQRAARQSAIDYDELLQADFDGHCRASVLWRRRLLWSSHTGAKAAPSLPLVVDGVVPPPVPAFDIPFAVLDKVRVHMLLNTAEAQAAQAVARRPTSGDAADTANEAHIATRVVALSSQLRAPSPVGAPTTGVLRSMLCDLGDVFRGEPAHYLLGVSLDWNPLALPGASWCLWRWRGVTSTIKAPQRGTRTMHAQGEKGWAAPRTVFGAAGRSLTASIVAGNRLNGVGGHRAGAGGPRRSVTLRRVSAVGDAAVEADVVLRAVQSTSLTTAKHFVHPRTSRIFAHEYLCGAENKHRRRRHEESVRIAAATTRRLSTVAGVAPMAATVGGSLLAEDDFADPLAGRNVDLDAAEQAFLERCRYCREFLRLRVLGAGVVTPLQAIVRGVLTRARLRRQLQAVVILQHFFKGVPLRRRFLAWRKESRLTGTLFPVLRGFLTRYRLGQRRAAVAVLQRVGRGYALARSPHPSSHLQGCSLPQLLAHRTKVRRFLATSAAKYKAKRELAERCVRLLQRCGRGHRGRLRCADKQRRAAARRQQRHVAALLETCRREEGTARFGIVDAEIFSRDAVVVEDKRLRRAIAFDAVAIKKKRAAQEAVAAEVALDDGVVASRPAGPLTHGTDTNLLVAPAATHSSTIVAEEAASTDLLLANASSVLLAQAHTTLQRCFDDTSAYVCDRLFNFFTNSVLYPQHHRPRLEAAWLSTYLALSGDEEAARDFLLSAHVAVVRAAAAAQRSSPVQPTATIDDVSEGPAAALSPLPTLAVAAVIPAAAGVSLFPAAGYGAAAFDANDLREAHVPHALTAARNLAGKGPSPQRQDTGGVEGLLPSATQGVRGASPGPAADALAASPLRPQDDSLTAASAVLLSAAGSMLLESPRCDSELAAEFLPVVRCEESRRGEEEPEEDNATVADHAVTVAEAAERAIIVAPSPTKEPVDDSTTTAAVATTTPGPHRRRPRQLPSERPAPTDLQGAPHGLVVLDPEGAPRPAPRLGGSTTRAPMQAAHRTPGRVGLNRSVESVQSAVSSVARAPSAIGPNASASASLHANRTPVHADTHRPLDSPAPPPIPLVPRMTPPMAALDDSSTTGPADTSILAALAHPAVLKAVLPLIVRLQRVGRGYMGAGTVAGCLPLYTSGARGMSRPSAPMGRRHLAFVFRHCLCARRRTAVLEARAWLEQVLEPAARALHAPDAFLVQRQELLTKMSVSMRLRWERDVKRSKAQLRKALVFGVLRPAVKTFAGTLVAVKHAREAMRQRLLDLQRQEQAVRFQQLVVAERLERQALWDARGFDVNSRRFAVRLQRTGRVFMLRRAAGRARLAVRRLEERERLDLAERFHRHALQALCTSRLDRFGGLRREQQQHRQRQGLHVVEKSLACRAVVSFIRLFNLRCAAATRIQRLFRRHAAHLAKRRGLTASGASIAATPTLRTRSRLAAHLASRHRAIPAPPSIAAAVAPVLHGSFSDVPSDTSNDVSFQLEDTPASESFSLAGTPRAFSLDGPRPLGIAPPAIALRAPPMTQTSAPTADDALADTQIGAHIGALDGAARLRSLVTAQRAVLRFLSRRRARAAHAAKVHAAVSVDAAVVLQRWTRFCRRRREERRKEEAHIGSGSAAAKRHFAAARRIQCAVRCYLSRIEARQAAEAQAVRVQARLRNEAASTIALAWRQRCVERAWASIHSASETVQVAAKDPADAGEHDTHRDGSRSQDAVHQGSPERAEEQAGAHGRTVASVVDMGTDEDDDDHRDHGPTTAASVSPERQDAQDDMWGSILGASGDTAADFAQTQRPHDPQDDATPPRSMPEEHTATDDDDEGLGILGHFLTSARGAGVSSTPNAVRVESRNISNTMPAGASSPAPPPPTSDTMDWEALAVQPVAMPAVEDDDWGMLLAGPPTAATLSSHATPAPASAPVLREASPPAPAAKHVQWQGEQISASPRDGADERKGTAPPSPVEEAFEAPVRVLDAVWLVRDGPRSPPEEAAHTDLPTYSDADIVHLWAPSGDVADGMSKQRLSSDLAPMVRSPGGLRDVTDLLGSPARPLSAGRVSVRVPVYVPMAPIVVGAEPDGGSRRATPPLRGPLTHAPAPTGEGGLIRTHSGRIIRHAPQPRVQQPQQLYPSARTPPSQPLPSPAARTPPSQPLPSPAALRGSEGRAADYHSGDRGRGVGGAGGDPTQHFSMDAARKGPTHFPAGGRFDPTADGGWTVNAHVEPMYVSRRAGRPPAGPTPVRAVMPFAHHSEERRPLGPSVVGIGSGASAARDLRSIAAPVPQPQPHHQSHSMRTPEPAEEAYQAPPRRVLLLPPPPAPLPPAASSPSSRWDIIGPPVAVVPTTAPSPMVVHGRFTTPSGTVVPALTVQGPSSPRPIHFPIRKHRRAGSPSSMSPQRQRPGGHAASLQYSPDARGAGGGKHLYPAYKQPVDDKFLSPLRRSRQAT